MAKFRYVITILTNEVCIQELPKSVYTSYHSGQNFLCSFLLSKNIKFKAYRNLILPVV